MDPDVLTIRSVDAHGSPFFTPRLRYLDLGIHGIFLDRVVDGSLVNAAARSNLIKVQPAHLRSRNELQYPTA